MRNRAVEATLLSEAEKYLNAGDFRWFFALAHGQITKQINDNLTSFQQPNALLMLNLHFAEGFIRAVNGQAHPEWRRAFSSAGALQRGSEQTVFLVGEIEFCGAKMANVHIHVDLSVRSKRWAIPPEDYSNGFHVCESRFSRCAGPTPRPVFRRH